MRVPQEPVCVDLFRQNPVFTSLHLKSPVHVVPPLINHCSYSVQWQSESKVPEAQVETAIVITVELLTSTVVARITEFSADYIFPSTKRHGVPALKRGLYSAVYLNPVISWS
jgi:hypothetical protein